MIQINANEAPSIRATSASCAALLRDPVTVDRFAREFVVPRDSVSVWRLDSGEYQYEAEMVPGNPMMRVFASGSPE